MPDKRPFIGAAIRMLDDILERMQDHQWKKRSLFRALQVSAGLLDAAPAASVIRSTPRRHGSGTWSGA